MPHQIPSLPVAVPAIATPRHTTTKVSQAHLSLYWSARRVTERFEQIVRESDAITVEPGPLTLPALRRTV